MSVEYESLELPSRVDRVRSALNRLRGSRNAMLGLGILVPVVTVVLLAPYLPLPDPTKTNVAHAFADPGGKYLLGTDNYGRDLLTRTLRGGRTSLLLGVTSVGLGLLLGVPTGLSAGYYGGRIDEFLMRSMDVLMSFPSLLLALLILVGLGGNIWNAIIAIGIVFTPRIARVVRGSTLSVKNEEFVDAARARGESDAYIMFREILPNITSPIIVEGSIRVGFGILIGTSLSFLGLGTQPPNPDWGYMIAQARNQIWQSVWPLVWPSLLLGITVVGFNLLGDGLRDALNPQIDGDDQ